MRYALRRKDGTICGYVDGATFISKVGDKSYTFGVDIDTEGIWRITELESGSPVGILRKVRTEARAVEWAQQLVEDIAAHAAVEFTQAVGIASAFARRLPPLPKL